MIEKGVKAKEINVIETGCPKYVIALYLNGKKIAKTKVDYVQFARHVTHTEISQRTTFNDGKNKFDVDSKLYKDLKTKLNLLTPGKHKLKIQYLPIFYKGTWDDITFKPIAEGEIEMIIADKKLN